MSKKPSQRPAQQTTPTKPAQAPAAPALKPSAAPLEGGKPEHFSGSQQVANQRSPNFANEGKIAVAIRTADTVQPSPPKK